MRRALLLTILAALLVSGAGRTAAIAQVMPDARQVSGVPLTTPELPVGTVTVRLFRERIGNNVAGHPVTLESDAGSRTGTTDAEGRVEFGGLQPGSTVTVRADIDGEALASQSFVIGSDGGTRVALIAGIAAAEARDAAEAAEAARQPARPGVVVLGSESRIVVEFQDDNLTVFYLLDIVNGAMTPVDTGSPLVFEVPAEATSTSLLEGSSPLGSVQGQRLVVTGPFPPGSTSVQLAYRLPWHGTSATITQKLPVAMDNVFVAVEKVGALQLSSSILTRQQEGQANGQAFLMGVGPRLNAGDALTFTLDGLPARSTRARNVTVGILAAILLWGAWASLTGTRRRVERTSSLATRRDALYDALVGLERAHASGRTTAADYEARRSELVMELEEVLGEIDSRAEPGLAGSRREGAPA